jgi:hypothetical protein
VWAPLGRETERWSTPTWEDMQAAPKSPLAATVEQLVAVHGGGARATLMYRGMVVCDHWAGTSDGKARPFDETTLVNTASCAGSLTHATLVSGRLTDTTQRECVAHDCSIVLGTKGVVAIAIARLVDQVRCRVSLQCNAYV